MAVCCGVERRRLWPSTHERTDLPELARFVLEAMVRLVCDLAQRLQAIEKKLISWHYRNDLSNRLETIPGVGFVTASALASIVPDLAAFRSGRHFAAWLVPRQNSSGGKSRLGHISKQGKALRESRTQMAIINKRTLINFA